MAEGVDTVTARPPSIDALARSLVGSGLPHPILVDIAREAVAAGDPASAAGRAEAFRRTLLTPVINATGVLLHTNLGRAPLAHHQPAHAQSIEFDLASGERGSRQRAVGQLLARLCEAEAAMVVNNNAAAVLLVLAALAQGRDVALVLKVHTSNYRIEGFAEATPVGELASLGVPVVVDIGSGLVDAAVPWLGGPPPAWLAGEPAAKQTLADGAALVTFSGDKLFGGPQAGVIAGRADLVAACARHPLARALRPGGLVLAALQETTLAYLRRDAAATVPFWRMVSQPVGDLHARAERLADRTGVGRPAATEALPGAGSAPGTTIASYGLVLDGDRTAHLRAHPIPVITRARDGSTYLDLRTVDPSDDDELASALVAAR